jgi:hypothetical protein
MEFIGYLKLGVAGAPADSLCKEKHLIGIKQHGIEIHIG